MHEAHAGQSSRRSSGSTNCDDAANGASMGTDTTRMTPVGTGTSHDPDAPHVGAGVCAYAEHALCGHAFTVTGTDCGSSTFKHAAVATTARRRPPLPSRRPTVCTGPPPP